MFDRWMTSCLVVGLLTILIVPSLGSVAQSPSGGGIGNEPPSVEAFYHNGSDPRPGDVISFEGVVRDRNGERDIEALSVSLLHAPPGIVADPLGADLQSVPDTPVAGGPGLTVWDEIERDGRLAYSFDYLLPTIGSYRFQLQVRDAAAGDTRILDVAVTRAVPAQGDPVELTIETPNGIQFADAIAPLPYDATARDHDGNVVILDDAVDIIWSVSGGAHFEGNILHPPAKAGEYIVNAALKRDPHIQAPSVSFRVVPGPVATVQVVPPQVQILEGRAYTFQASAFDAAGNMITGARFSWSLSDPAVGSISPQSGTFIGKQPGHTNLTAHHPQSGFRATAHVEVVDLTGLVEGIQIDASLTGHDLVVASGSSLAFLFQGVDQDGKPIGGLPITYTVADPAIGIITPEGVFMAFQAGSTQIHARLDDLEAHVNITVVPGPIAQIRVFPPSAAVPAGGALDLDAFAFDGYGNRIPDVSFRWFSGSALAEVDPITGLFQAGDAPGEVRITASSFGFHREAVVYILAPSVADLGGTLQDAQHLTSTLANVQTDTHVIGFSQVFDGASVQMVVPQQGPTKNLEGATLELGDDASNLAIIVETQPGTLAVVPDEIDVIDLHESVQRIGANVPGIFITVLVTEDGRVVDSGRLNALIQGMGVTFRVESAYFQDRSLDPARATLIEYSDGAKVREDISVTLLARNDPPGFHTFHATLREFSSFAFVAPPRPPVPGGSGGGGGGGGGAAPSGDGGGCSWSHPHMVVDGIDDLVRRVDFGRTHDRCPVIPEVDVRDDAPPTAARSGLPAGVKAWRFVEITTHEMPPPAHARFTLALPDEPDHTLRHGLAYVLEPTGWRLANGFPITRGAEGVPAAEVDLPCCGVYLFAHDVLAPVVDLTHWPTTWTQVHESEAAVTDNIGVVSVMLELDGRPYLTLERGPYRYWFDPARLVPGEHEVVVSALDASGNEGSSTVHIMVPEPPWVGQAGAGGSVFQEIDRGVNPIAILGALVVLGAVGRKKWFLVARRRRDEPDEMA